MYHGYGDNVSAQILAGRSSADRNPASMLPQPLTDVLRSKSLVINELLRYFWASYPVNSAARELKVKKIKAALKMQHSRYNEVYFKCNA